jgi:hypothetical protein
MAETRQRLGSREPGPRLADAPLTTWLSGTNGKVSSTPQQQFEGKRGCEAVCNSDGMEDLLQR